jgi:hypothetical protein
LKEPFCDPVKIERAISGLERDSAMRFSTSAFFHGSVSLKSLSPVYQYGRFEFFQKFVEIFTAQGAPPVLWTLVTNGKIFNQKD